MWLFEPTGAIDPKWPKEAHESFYIGAAAGGAVTEYLVSRKKDPVEPHKIAISWNPSVSRKHAVFVTAVVNDVATLRVMDHGSKVGTFVFLPSGSKERVGTNAKMDVPDSCDIEIGSSRYKVTRVTAVLSSCGAAAGPLTAKAKQHGVILRGQVSPDVSVVVMNERTVTQKAILGLCHGCLFTTPQWLDQLIGRCAEGITLRRDVEPAKHAPPLTDKTLQNDGGSLIPWNPNPERRRILAGRHVLAFHENQQKALQAVVIAAGGTMEMVTQETCDSYESHKSALLKDGKTVLLKTGKKYVATLSAAQKGRRDRLQALIKRCGGLREISDKDIYIGIVKIDSNYCDPTRSSPASKAKGRFADSQTDSASQFSMSMTGGAPMSVAPTQDQSLGMQSVPPSQSPIPAVKAKPAHPAKKTTEPVESLQRPKRTRSGDAADVASAAAPVQATASKAKRTKAAEEKEPSAVPESEQRQRSRRTRGGDTDAAASASAGPHKAVPAEDTGQRPKRTRSGDADSSQPAAASTTKGKTAAKSAKPVEDSASSGKRRRVEKDVLVPDSQSGEEEDAGESNKAKLAKPSERPSEAQAREAWDGPDGTPMVEFIDLIVTNTTKPRPAPQKLPGGRKNFKVFRKGGRAATDASTARRQVLEVTEAEGEWTSEALKEMEAETARYKKADAEAADDGEFGEAATARSAKSRSQRTATQSQSGKREKRKRR